MEIPTHKEWTEYIKAHLVRSGEKPSAFGRRVLGDSSAVTSLIEGNDPRLSTMLKIERAIRVKEGKNASRA